MKLLALLLVAIPSCISLGEQDTRPEPYYVRFTEEAEVAMRFLYERVQNRSGGVEFAACLNYIPRDSTYLVHEIVIPHQLYNTLTSIEKISCQGYPGLAHSHPVLLQVRDCGGSQADLRTFQNKRFQFMVIWCSNEGDYFYKTHRGTFGYRLDGVHKDVRVGSEKP